MIRRGSRRNSIQPARNRPIVFFRNVSRTLIRLPAPRSWIFQRIPRSCSARQPASSIAGQLTSVGAAGRCGIGDRRRSGEGTRYDLALDQHRFDNRELTLVWARRGAQLGWLVRRPARAGGPPGHASDPRQEASAMRRCPRPVRVPTAPQAAPGGARHVSHGADAARRRDRSAPTGWRCRPDSAARRRRSSEAPRCPRADPGR